MAVSAASSFLSRLTDFSLHPLHPPKPRPLRFLTPPRSLSAAASCRRVSSPPTVVSCLISGVDGGGVSDEFVSTRKSTFDRGFIVIVNMLQRIEPLDASVISKGVSDSAKDSMKQTISRMLGLLPSDQFSVTVTVSKRPLDRLLFSSIITGYTLWNGEYRMSLMRNLDISRHSAKGSNCPMQTEVFEALDGKDRNVEIGSDSKFEDLESCSPRVFGDLSPEALYYIQQLQSELTDVKKVTELSRPSSIEVEDIIYQLVQNIVRRFIGDHANKKFMEQSLEGNIHNHSDGDDELCDTVGTSRDYLAKLLFWCMLLGHHLRGLENRLNLSCAVGLL